MVQMERKMFMRDLLHANFKSVTVESLNQYLKTLIIFCADPQSKILCRRLKRKGFNSRFKHVVFQFAYNVMLNIIYNNYILNKVIICRK